MHSVLFPSRSWLLAQQQNPTTTSPAQLRMDPLEGTVPALQRLMGVCPWGEGSLKAPWGAQHLRMAAEPFQSCMEMQGHSLKQSSQLGQLHSGVPPEEHSDHHTSILHLRTQQGSELLLSPLWACSTCRAVRPCHGSAVSRHPRMGWSAGRHSIGDGNSESRAQESSTRLGSFPAQGLPPSPSHLSLWSPAALTNLCPRRAPCEGKSRHQPCPTATLPGSAANPAVPNPPTPHPRLSGRREPRCRVSPRFALLPSHLLRSVAAPAALVQLSGPNPARGRDGSAPHGTEELGLPRGGHRNRTPSRAAAPRDAHGATRGIGEGAGGRLGSFCLFFFGCVSG